MWVSEKGGFRAEVNNLPAENEWRIRRHGNLLTGEKSPSQASAAVTHRAGGEGNAKWHHAGDRGAGNLMTGSAMLGKAPSLATAIRLPLCHPGFPWAPAGRPWCPASALYSDGIPVGNGSLSGSGGGRGRMQRGGSHLLPGPAVVTQAREGISAEPAGASTERSAG